ncbi:helix-turn-helix domain-containing protein [Actinoplanes sp. NPDC051494]|uniref:helix-turn-helix domain-containing protein n=1 Tax=Actinoplanes sp. NPDC051494 TaxID=3363907 RepID=UPI003799A734
MYAERPSSLPHVTAWRSVVPPDSPATRVLPDGCLDVIWQDGSVLVAGPDTTAQVAPVPVAGSRFFALRFADGVGPGILGVPADELTDRQVPLDELMPSAVVRAVAEADDPPAALEEFARRRWRAPDQATRAVAAGARAGLTVAAIADSCGLSPRHLQRRCASSFGYAPKTLTRIVRFQRAMGLARAGRPFAEVSVLAGYADQAHLSRDVRALAGLPLGQLVT